MTTKLIRAFLALEVPDAVKTQLAVAQEKLRRELPRARWTRPDGWHLTLKFLGEVAAPALDELAAALRGTKSIRLKARAARLAARRGLRQLAGVLIEEFAIPSPWYRRQLHGVLSLWIDAPIRTPAGDDAKSWERVAQRWRSWWDGGGSVCIEDTCPGQQQTR